MSRIAEARKLADDIHRVVEDMPYVDGLEVHRVYECRMGLIYSIRMGWVTQVSAEAVEELQNLYAELTSERMAQGRELMAVVQAGDTLEFTLYATGERVTGTVVAMEGRHGVVVQVPGRYELRPLNMFWNFANIVLPTFANHSN